jgi:hypothetical protein
MLVPHVIPIVQSSEQKATLISEALHALRAAHAIDERDDLDASSFLVWYDATIPEVKDIEILSAAMRIELSKRRGDRLALEGERRGGNSKVTRRVTLLPRERKQRSHDRLMAAQPSAVDTYVRREAKAGRAPTVTAAVRAAKSARVAKSQTPSPSSRPPRPMAQPDLSTFQKSVRAEVHERILQVAGRTMTLEALGKCWGLHADNARRYLREAALYGEVAKDGDQYTITLVDADRLEAFKKTLLAEVKRQRKEAGDGYRGWRPDNVHSMKQSTLLDAIEDALRPKAH